MTQEAEQEDHKSEVSLGNLVRLFQNKILKSAEGAI